MSQRAQLTVVGAILVAVAFAGGVIAGSTGVVGIHAPVLTGAGYVGDHVVSLSSGGDWYGARGSIAWRDTDGSEHDGGWPECLPTTTEVAGIPFSGTVVWHGDSGFGTILWVDCSRRG